LTESAKTEYASRLLEVLEIRAAEDGEYYARSVHDLLQHMENNQQLVLESLVEIVLNYIRQGKSIIIVLSQSCDKFFMFSQVPPISGYNVRRLS